MVMRNALINLMKRIALNVDCTHFSKLNLKKNWKFIGNTRETGKTFKTLKKKIVAAVEANSVFLIISNAITQWTVRIEAMNKIAKVSLALICFFIECT